MWTLLYGIRRQSVTKPDLSTASRESPKVASKNLEFLTEKEIRRGSQRSEVKKKKSSEATEENFISALENAVGGGSGKERKKKKRLATENKSVVLQQLRTRTVVLTPPIGGQERGLKREDLQQTSQGRHHHITFIKNQYFLGYFHLEGFGTHTSLNQ